MQRMSVEDFHVIERDIPTVDDVIKPVRGDKRHVHSPFLDRQGGEIVPSGINDPREILLQGLAGIRRERHVRQQMAGSARRVDQTR